MNNCSFCTKEATYGLNKTKACDDHVEYALANEKFAASLEQLRDRFRLFGKGLLFYNPLP